MEAVHAFWGRTHAKVLKQSKNVTHRNGDGVEMVSFQGKGGKKSETGWQDFSKNTVEQQVLGWGRIGRGFWTMRLGRMEDFFKRF